MAFLIQFLFWAVPLGAIAFFIVSLILYLRAKRQPDSVSREKLKTRKFLLVVSSVIAGVLAAVVIGFIALMFLAVAFM